MLCIHAISTLAAGTLIGLLAAKIKIPGGLLVGAIIGAAILNVFTGTAYMPKDTKLFVQIIAGAFIGCTAEKSDIKRLPCIIKPALIMILGFLLLNMSAGFSIYLLSPLDLVTALMSAVPGGISDTPIIAADMGADAPKVAVMQVVRQILGIGVFPSLILLYDNKAKSKGGYGNAYTEIRTKSKRKSVPALICTLLAAAVFGMLGKLSGISAGTFVFAIIAVLVLKLVFDYAFIPKRIKQGAQLISGCYLGSAVTLSDILEIRYLLLPLVVIIAGYIANCFLTGAVIRKVCNFTRKEALLIATPAGASDMALISADIGVENTDVIILQVIRAVLVMTFFPLLIGRITA
ncbi:AbrB family transcriptional regulator [Treponema endosymbiont of Eucomonympha sp.]|uniref:AbrB family transcriptional regulator n=1 Tax=Treponema endosymbiont of Eucomonympha sp. TaxID=1580831 RepID=UPI000780AA78|nr:AbrB family transcriptional regulator [Treponema endosymbiont of Eucomonympha sp.]